MHDPSIAFARGCWQTFRHLAVTREESRMRSKWSRLRRILSAVVGTLLCVGAAVSDQPIAVLLDLSFDWPVIGSRGTVVPAIVEDRRGPHGQHGLTDDTLLVNPSWANIRRHDNVINLGRPGDNGRYDFDGFFAAGNFLVLGDRYGDLAGESRGRSSISIPFTIPALGHSLTISYDWVFDTDDSSNSDDFDVDLVDLEEGLTEVQSVPAPNSGTRGTTYLKVFSGPDLDALLGTKQMLRFQLDEGDRSGSSAVGIDNIRITLTGPKPSVVAVPEPASLFLLGVGLAGLAALRRQRQVLLSDTP
jgi:hypothetical protein